MVGTHIPCNNSEQDWQIENSLGCGGESWRSLSKLVFDDRTKKWTKKVCHLADICVMFHQVKTLEEAKDFCGRTKIMKMSR